MRPIPPIAERQFGAFTGAQAHDAGWTESALRNAVRHGDLERLRRGVFALPAAPTDDRRAGAAAGLARSAAAVGLTNPRVPISHASSAALMDLPLVQVPRHICVTVARTRRGCLDGAHLHREAMTPADLHRANRILVTSPARTVVDVGRENGVDAAIVAADAALRRGLVTPHQLAATLTRCAGWPGARAASVAVELADPRAESPLESISRLRIHQAGLPAPQPQSRILDAGGRFVGRVDLYWDEFGVVAEVDGLAKYDAGDGTTLRAEKIRQELLEQCGLVVVRWGWSDLRDFAAVEARLRAAFARGSAPDRAARRWTARPTAA